VVLKSGLKQQLVLFEQVPALLTAVREASHLVAFGGIVQAAVTVAIDIFGEPAVEDVVSECDFFGLRIAFEERQSLPLVETLVAAAWDVCSCNRRSCVTYASDGSRFRRSITVRATSTNFERR
jgi:hypothetical protein